MLMPATFPVEAATVPIPLGAVLLGSVVAWFIPKVRPTQFCMLNGVMDANLASAGQTRSHKGTEPFSSL